MWWMALACAAPVAPHADEAPAPRADAVDGEPSPGEPSAGAPAGAADPSVGAPTWAPDPHPPLPLADPAVGRLVVEGQGPARVTWTLPGSNGCYRQEPAVLSVDGSVLTLAYATRREGEVCSMALVPGGFSGVLSGVLPGWTVRVVVDGVERATAVLGGASPG